jgi:NADH-quinone oxidoreductase subunit J
MNFAFNPDLKLYVALADAAFVAFALVALLGGMVAVGARSLIHAVLGLALALAGVAGIYVYLGTHFIAAMQILIYVGAVCISLVFAVMLARPPSDAETHPAHLPGKMAAGLVVGLFAALVLGTAVVSHPWQAAPAVTVDASIAQVGKRLLTSYGFVFELISLVLLIAIVGSVVLAKRGRGTPGGAR